MNNWRLNRRLATALPILWFTLSLSGVTLDSLSQLPIWMVFVALVMTALIGVLIREPYKAAIDGVMGLLNIKVILVVHSLYARFRDNHWPALQEYPWTMILLSIVVLGLLVWFLVITPIRESGRVIKRAFGGTMDIENIDPSYDEGYNDEMRSWLSDEDYRRK